MSPISGYLTPEARATLDAVFAKLAAPGMCNSADDEPCVSGTPSQAAIDGDTRSAGQRNHDALLAAAARPAGLRRARSAQRAAGHASSSPPPCKNWKPAPGSGLTGGGTLLPMSRCDPAGPPRPPLPGHLRQRQSARALSHQTAGLTRPNELCCTPKIVAAPTPAAPCRPTYCEVHHCTDYATNPITDVNDLTFGLRPQPPHSPNKAGPPAKTPTATPNGSHPPHLDRGQPRINTYHHPEKLLRDDDDEEDGP